MQFCHDFLKKLILFLFFHVWYALIVLRQCTYGLHFSLCSCDLFLRTIGGRLHSWHQVSVWVKQHVDFVMRSEKFLLSSQCFSHVVTSSLFIRQVDFLVVVAGHMLEPPFFCGPDSDRRSSWFPIILARLIFHDGLLQFSLDKSCEYSCFFA